MVRKKTMGFLALAFVSSLFLLNTATTVNAQKFEPKTEAYIGFTGEDTSPEPSGTPGGGGQPTTSETTNTTDTTITTEDTSTEETSKSEETTPTGGDSSGATNQESIASQETSSSSGNKDLQKNSVLEKLLPATGESRSTLLLVVGMGMLIACSVYILKRKKRGEESES